MAKIPVQVLPISGVAAKSDPRDVMKCVNIHCDGDDLIRAIAVNGHFGIIAKWNPDNIIDHPEIPGLFNEPAEDPVEYSVNIPCTEWDIAAKSKIKSELDKNFSPFILNVEDNELYTGNHSDVTRGVRFAPIDNKYPDVEQIFAVPRSQCFRFKINPKEMITLLKTMIAMLPECTSYLELMVNFKNDQAPIVITPPPEANEVVEIIGGIMPIKRHDEDEGEGEGEEETTATVETSDSTRVVIQPADETSENTAQ